MVRELRGTALLMCGDWHRAEDATQEALMRLYVAWPRLERGGAGVTRVHIEWPDKTANDYPVVNGYDVARHTEKRVQRLIDPKVRDMQNFPPIYISFYDAAGNLLIRYNQKPVHADPGDLPD